MVLQEAVCRALVAARRPCEGVVLAVKRSRGDSSNFVAATAAETNTNTNTTAATTSDSTTGSTTGSTSGSGSGTAYARLGVAAPPRRPSTSALAFVPRASLNAAGGAAKRRMDVGGTAATATMSTTTTSGSAGAGNGGGAHADSGGALSNADFRKRFLGV